MHSALSFILGKAEFLIPCPFKYFTHLDCPGCGFQRAVIALFSGDLHQSFILYPPAIPFLISASMGLSAIVFKWKTETKFLKICYVTTGAIVLINYCYKILTHHLY
jgi:hypothetical protein